MTHIPPPSRDPADDPLITPEAVLAAQVLHRAVLDAATPHYGGAVQADARRFLSGQEDGGRWLRFWTDVAGVKPEAVRVLVGRALAKGNGRSRGGAGPINRSKGPRV
jgi:hypothetical protein